MREQKVILKRMFAILFAICMVFSFSFSSVPSTSVYAAAGTFVFDGTNGTSYAGQSSVMINADIPDNCPYFQTSQAKESIRSIIIGENVRSIGVNAFKDCNNVTIISVGTNVMTIGERAFYGTAISSISLPASLKLLGTNAFGNCQRLVSFSIDASNSIYKSLEGVIFSYDQEELIMYPVGLTSTSYTIPSTVTTIKEYAFAGCKLTSITIPENVLYIENNAFRNSKKMSTAFFSDTDLEIGEGAFYGTAIKSTILYSNISYVEKVESDDVSDDTAKYVELDISARRIKVGETFKLTATFINDENLSDDDKTLAWTTSNETIATFSVNEDSVTDGKTRSVTVNAISVGKSTITVTTADGKSVTCMVYVYSEDDEGREVPSFPDGLDEPINNEYIDCVITKRPSITVLGNPTQWSREALLSITGSTGVTRLIVESEITDFLSGEDAFATYKVTKNGTYTIIARTSDGTTTTKTVTVSKVDADAPSVVQYSLTDTLCELTSTDALSGLEHIYYSLNGATYIAYTDAFNLETGKNTLVTYAVDKCGNRSTEKTYEIEIANVPRGITTDTSVELSKGQEYDLKVKFSPTNTINRKLSYESSNPNVAEVDENGKITAKSVGVATITVMTATYLTAECEVFVNDTVLLGTDTLEIYTDKTKNIKLRNTREDYSIIYECDDTSICKVNSSGKVTGIKAGEATIVTTVTTPLQTYTFKTVVTVIPSSIEITTKKASLKVGQTFTFKATKVGISKAVKWSISNSKIASINKTTGKVKAKKKGVVTITAKAGGKKATCKMTVRK